jgi:antitoxin component HigA of HigAB toxin-antitoxin module
MKKTTHATTIPKDTLEKFSELDRPIESEIQHELTLRAIQKLRGPIREDGETEMAPEVVELRKALVNRVSEYEKQEYPFGQPNFEEWAGRLTGKELEAKLSKIREAEEVVDQVEAFERQRVAFIKRRLKERNLKQKNLGEILKLDPSNVSHLLKGRRDFTIEIVSRLHHKLGMPYDQLMPPENALD